MGEIIIKHADQTTTNLQNRAMVSKITRAEQRQQLLGEDILDITVQSAAPVPCEIGDQISIYGSAYRLNQMPTLKRTGERRFEQTFTFEGTQYELLDVQWFVPGANTDSLTGNLPFFLDQLIANANRVYPGTWIRGETPADTETKTLTYTEMNCLQVLQNFCQEWSTEFLISVNEETGTRTVNLKTVGVQFPYIFRYGKTGGLYELSRQSVNSLNVLTRLYAFGDSRNLGNKYRANKLCLPGKERNNSFVEEQEAIDLYGVKENTKVFNDIYPARVGSITSLGSEYFAFRDSTMFDLNEKEADGVTTKWLLPGVTAKIRMQTGGLAGYEFDIHAYDHGSKEIKVVPFVDENSFKFPSETSPTFQFSVGDKYIITDINLPDQYIAEAEDRLLEEAEKYYQQYKQPQVQYSLSIDENFLKQFAGEVTIQNLFAVGDQIRIQDADIGVDKFIRISGLTRDLLHPYKYTLTITDAAYSRPMINRIISDIQDINETIKINNLSDPYKARRNWLASQELLSKTFDPEGYYYAEKIKPLSIETTMLQVGAKSQQLVLQDVLFEPNYQGNPNRINIVAGSLLHYTINEQPTTWSLAGATVNDLLEEESYFVYARCKRDGSEGNIVIDSTQYMIDQDPSWYYFVIGHLSSVIGTSDDNPPARTLSLTYGSTAINGRFVKTGRIVSIDGKTYFDLDSGEIVGKIKFILPGDQDPTDLAEWAGTAQEEIEGTDYLKEALKKSTQVQGGLVLAKIIAATNAAGQVKSYQNGDPTLNDIAFAAGVDNFGTPQETAKSVDRHDGSGYRAGGALKWNAAGQTLVRAGVMSPFVNSDNSIVRGDGETLTPNIFAINYHLPTTGIGVFYSLPQDKELNGAVLRLHNLNGGRNSTFQITCYESGYNGFYDENGPFSTLTLQQGEAVELICVANEDRFISWDVVRRYKCRPWISGEAGPVN